MRHNLALALGVSAVLAAAPAFAGDTPQPVYSPYGKNVVVQGMDGGYPVTINGSFSVSATNPSVGTDNAAAPGSSTQVGIQDGAGKLQAVSATNPLPISGTISASNPSVGTNAAAIPGSATLVGTKDGSGNLQPVSAANPLKVDGSGATQPVSGTVTATQATGSNLHVQVDTAPTTAVTGTFWQATQPISAAALPLPSGASQDRTTAAAPNACRLSDGAAFYKPTTPSDTQPVTGTFWQATQPVSVADTRVTGTISAASSFGSIGGNSWNSTSCAANACVTATVNGNADANVYITGQWSGTVYIDGSPDGTNWTDMVVSSMGVLVAPTFHSGLAGAGTASTANAVYKLNVAGFQQVRVRAATGTTFGAANITVQWNITPASGSTVSLDRPLPTGSNTLGAVTQSGTWSVSQAGTWNMNALQSGTWTVQPGNTANTVAWKVDNSGVTQPVSAAALPLPSGAATAAKQPALGTAGTPSADVLTVQGATSMTPLKVDGSASTQPISGTVTANLGTLNGAALDATLTGRTAKAQITDGTRDGTVKAASTLPAATDTALVTTPRDATPDTRVTGTVSAASSFGAISANNWSSTSCAANACVVATVSGNGSSSVFITGQWSGTVYVEGAPDGTNWTPMIVQNMATVAGSPTFHSGLVGAGTGATQTAMYRFDSSGFQSVRLRAGTGTTFGAANIAVTWNLTNVAMPMATISNALPAGTNAVGGVTQSGTWTVQPGNTANSTAWKVDGSAVTQPVSGTFWQATQPVSGTVTANIGTAGTLALDATLTGGTQQTKITDGTNVATVKAASTLPASTDKAVVVTTRDSVAVTGTFWQATQPVSGTVAATESGTWTVQPGNTANSTPWLVKPNDGTNSITVKAASTAAVAGDTSEVVAISPNSNTVQNIDQSSTAVTYASSSATVGTPTATGSNGSITYLWHPSTSAKRVEIDHIGVVCSAGAATTGGYLLLSLVRITAENGTPGGVTATTANPKTDNADANSTITLRWGASGAPTRATNAAVNQLIPNNAWNGSEVVMWDTTKTGKPLVARASVSEGWEVYVSTSTTMSTAATCEANFYWTEI